jgi:hypothetical protein
VGPEQQMRAQIERRAVSIRARQAAVTTPALEVVQGEIMD